MNSDIKNHSASELYKNLNKQYFTPSGINNSDSYFYIFNYRLNTISFIDETFTSITGYEVSDITIEKLIDKIHPEDKSYFIDCVEKNFKFKSNLKFEEHFKFQYSFSFRAKIKSGQYITIRQTTQAIEVNENGQLVRSIITHEKINDYVTRPENDYKVYDKSRCTYLNTQNSYKLTKRENEILNLVREGLNSNEIAERLFTSKYTIDTHRKNILNKTNSSNFIELIRKLSK